MTIDFYEDILGGRDSCSNCFGLRRREVTTVRSAWGDVETHYERDRRTTGVCYVPDVPASSSRRVHCSCGVLAPHVRLWDDADVYEDAERFRGLVKRLLLTLAEKGAIETRSEAEAVSAAAFAARRSMPHPEHHGPYADDRPTTVNEVFAAAFSALDPEGEDGEDRQTRVDSTDTTTSSSDSERAAPLAESARG